MARIVVECADPNDPVAVEAAMEDMVGKCNVTYFQQAEQMKAAGSATSDRDAARKIAKDAGESEGAVRLRIQRGREVAQGVPPNKSKQDQKFILNQAKEIKTERRKERRQGHKRILSDGVCKAVDGRCLTNANEAPFKLSRARPTI